MMRKVFSVICYIIGGFFVYMVCLLAFINMPQVGATKFLIMGGFSIPAFVFLLIGAAICRFHNWQSSIGITLISGVGFNLFIVITFICYQLSPELSAMFPDDSLSSFNDYVSGFSIMFVLSCLGIFMIRNNRSNVVECISE